MSELDTTVTDADRAVDPLDMLRRIEDIGPERWRAELFDLAEYALAALARRTHAAERIIADSIHPNVDGNDGTERLCQAVYGRPSQARDYLGGSAARMLHDGAELIEKLRRNLSELQAHNLDAVADLILERWDRESEEHKRSVLAAFVLVVGQQRAELASLRYDLPQTEEYYSAVEDRAALRALLTAEFGTNDPAELPRLFAQRRELYQRLLTAARAARDAWGRGDDKCWKDLVAIFQALPEGFELPATDTRVELAYCEQYLRSCHHPGVKYVSPQRRIEELETALREIVALPVCREDESRSIARMALEKGGVA